jgi:hypothetical protein
MSVSDSALNNLQINKTEMEKGSVERVEVGLDPCVGTERAEAKPANDEPTCTIPHPSFYYKPFIRLCITDHHVFKMK